MTGKKGTGKMSEKPTETLFILNEGPYGNERSYNALRLAMNLVRESKALVKVFLVGDGVACAKRRQETPKGYYNIERMVSSLARRGEVAG
jgi:uncharacterized protein involved in oxidation of intracellular sulfur